MSNELIEMTAEEQQTAARDMEVYAAMIDYLDGQIKRVFDRLRETGEYDNTLIIFMSDNGANGAMPTAYPGQTDEFLTSFDNSLENRGLANSYIETGPGWAQASMAPSRMYKGFTAEGGIRAPLIVKLPGQMADAGTMNHSFIHMRDIMPTILDLADAVHPEEFDGREVRPMQGRSALYLIAGRVESPSVEICQVGYELFGLKAYIAGDWKILWMPPPVGKGDWELFNLREDPGEMNDLSKLHPERVEEMAALWEQYRIDNNVLDISYDMTTLQ